MSKIVSSLELTLNDRPRHQTLMGWLYAELRSAILEGRLGPGTRLPASRDFARLHHLSRGTVVNVFERLQAEGYLSSVVGSGTWVNDRVKLPSRTADEERTLPAYIRRVAASYVRPKPWMGLAGTAEVLPFQMHGPDLREFPAKLWEKLASRRVHTFKSWLQAEDDGRGYGPLREAVASYLSTSRGVRCNANQLVLVSGAQQALDLLLRLLVQPGEAVWMEDPGYSGATIALDNIGAKIIPVPVDAEGLSVLAGKRLCARPKGIYVTPAHQFPMGMTMSLKRRMEVLDWAARSGSFIIEDDYDSEYRFEGKPVPSLQSLDRNSNVILMGSFSKVLFPSLRLGYVVLPPSLADYFLAFRYKTDLRSISFDQAVLHDFIVGGHLGRHIRRMREIYGNRLATLTYGVDKHLNDVLKIQNVKAGLYTVGFLKNGMSSREAETAAGKHGIEAIALDRFTLKRSDPRGVLLGFAGFNDVEIRSGLIQLGAALRC